MTHMSAEIRAMHDRARATVRADIVSFRRSKFGTKTERRWVAARWFRTQVRRFWEESICLLVLGAASLLVYTDRLLGWPLLLGAIGYFAYVAKFRRERSFDARPIDGTNYSDHDLAKRDFRSLTLKSSQFTGAVMRSARMADNNFFDIAFSRADISDASIRNTTFDHCRFSWTDFTKTTFERNCKAKNSTFRKAKFYGTTLKGVVFDDCGLEFSTWHNATLTNCEFKNVRFDGADLRNCTFEKCTFKNVDFRDADLSTANFIDTKESQAIWWSNAKFADGVNRPPMAKPFDAISFVSGPETTDWFTAGMSIRLRYLPRFLLLAVGVLAATVIATAGETRPTLVAIADDAGAPDTTIPSTATQTTLAEESGDLPGPDSTTPASTAPQTTVAATTVPDTTTPPITTPETTTTEPTTTTTTSTTTQPPSPPLEEDTQDVAPQPTTTTVPPIPEQPNGVSIEPGGNELKVRWAAVSGSGPEVADSFVAVASPGGQRCTAVATKRTCVIRRLSATESYTVKVFAKNENGRSRATQTKAQPIEPDNRIVVRAKGEQADERFDVMVGDTVVGTATAGTTYKKYRFTASPSLDGEVSVVFINDHFDGEVDRTLWLDKVIVNGQSIEAESNKTFGKGIWTDSGRCGAGFGQTEKLTCGGYMVFGRV